MADPVSIKNVNASMLYRLANNSGMADAKAKKGIATKEAFIDRTLQLAGINGDFEGLYRAYRNGYVSACTVVTLNAPSV